MMSEIAQDKLSDTSETIVEDEASKDVVVKPIQYDVTSFGADYDVDGLVKRLRRGDMFIPNFQRSYVWNQVEASRLIESLLLGLPVPGIFLSREPDSNKLLVIDGQQRLKTLQFFYDGYFKPSPEEKTRKVFGLTKVQSQFNELTYETLSEKDRIKLDDSIIHATVVKQENPENDNTSIFHIFERLNNGGKKLAPQEIRVAIYHGKLIELIKSLNDTDSWRAIFGRKNTRLKDQELILRFLALFFDAGKYERPMNEFLNTFSKKHQNPSEDFINYCEMTFEKVIGVISRVLGVNAFRPERALNAAVFDSVMYGLAKRLVDSSTVDDDAFKKAYEELLSDPEYISATSRATSNEQNVELRLKKALEAFVDV